VSVFRAGDVAGEVEEKSQSKNWLISQS
jgi:hypothetical protein